MVGWDILYPIQIGLKEKESLPEFLWLLQVSLYPLLQLLQRLTWGTADVLKP
jgi:hypothetical protein